VHQSPDHADIVWAAVDQVTKTKNRVFAGRKINVFEQLSKTGIAALNISDEVE
jgi:hypothetical protein